MSAPPVAATPTRLSVEYLVSGIWNARRPAVQINTIKSPSEFAVQSSPDASAANRISVPRIASVTPYDWRIFWELNRIDGGPETADELEGVVDARFRRAHQCAADDDAIGQSRDGRRLFGSGDAESYTHGEIGHAAQHRDRRRKLGSDVAALPRDAKPADEVHEPAAVSRDLSHPMPRGGGGDEANVGERTVREVRLERGVGPERQVRDEQPMRPRRRGAGERVGTRGDDGIQVAEQHDRARQSGLSNEV